MENRKNNIVRKIIRRILIAFIIILIVGGITGYQYTKKSLEPMDNKSEEVIEVEIPMGSTRKEIASILSKNNLIKNKTIFEYYVKFKGNSDFQAGTYLMSPSMSVEELAKYLNKGDTPIMIEKISEVTIPEGINLEEISEKIEEQTDFSKEDFMELIENKSFIEELLDEYPQLLTEAVNTEDTRYTLEGYLFPATYDIYYSTTLEELVFQMVSQMDTVLEPFYDEIDQLDLSVHELLALASYIEREGNTTEDRKLISGVFYNRLEEEMPLQTDLSVIYALGEHKEWVSYKDLEVESPYNTYIHEGVGAGPINSPSSEAIEAAVHPTKTDDMYFLADLETGKIYYAKTYEKHLEYKKKYLDNND